GLQSAADNLDSNRIDRHNSSLGSLRPREKTFPLELQQETIVVEFLRSGGFCARAARLGGQELEHRRDTFLFGKRRLRKQLGIIFEAPSGDAVIGDAHV